MISSRCPRPIGVIASMAMMPGLQRLLDRLPAGDARGDRFPAAGVSVDIERAFAVERIAQRIDDAADQRIADGHRQQLAGGADFIPFGDLQVIAEDDHADGVFFQVEDLARARRWGTRPFRRTSPSERP